MQEVQSASDVIPVAVLHLPTEHLLSHTVIDVCASPEVEKRPATQAIQTLLVVCPGPDVEKVPATQGLHSLRPVVSPYLPEGQSS